MANPHTADTPHWEAAFDHYYQDRVLEAFDEISDHGIGEAGELLRWYRVMEAEALTRRKSRVVAVSPWLSIEYVETQTLGLEIELGEKALEACNEVAGRLAWNHEVKTLLSVLAEEADAPWAANPYGYCVSKEPFEKICLPNYLVDDPTEFSQAVAHEYAHVISSHVASDYAPRWVEEAVSVLVERRFDPEIWRLFCDKESSWLDETQLEATLIDPSAHDEERDPVYMAYQQAGWIGKYLSEKFGDSRLGEFLRAIADESLTRNVMRGLLGRDRTEMALRHVYGLSKADLFSQSLAWIRGLDRTDL